MHRNSIILILFVVIILYNFVLFALIGFLVPLVYRLKRQEFESKLRGIEANYQGELLKSQLEIQESTISALALELHDNIGQKIYLSQLYLGLLVPEEESFNKNVSALESSLMEAAEGLHDVLKNLSLDPIKKGDLRNAIDGLVNQLLTSTAYKVDFREQGSYHSLPANQEIFLFRIFQEIINNIIRHAQARCIEIQFINTPERLLLSVRDDGVGFENVKPADPDAPTRYGKGLENMVARANLIKAEINIMTNPGLGTLVEVSLRLLTN